MHDQDRMRCDALEPRRSVVVEACAGSGKTWLLVSRIVRLLLAGAEPNAILAITFTRQAAQEMAERLQQWLKLLATGSDEQVRAFLRAREVPAHEMEQALVRGRSLYEQVLTAQPGITLSTFHSWFLQLLRSAPLQSEAVGEAALIERTSTLLQEAWMLCMEDCRRAPEGETARAFEFLFAEYGLQNVRALLGRFVQHRADWWAYAGRDRDAVARALAKQAAALALTPDMDPGAALFADAGFVSEVRAAVELFARNGGEEGGRAQRVAVALEESAAAAFQALRHALLTRKDAPRKRGPSKERVRKLGARGEARYHELCERLGARVLDALQARADAASYRANGAGLRAGVALLEHYAALKQERQVVDFADVEWLAYELLAREEHALAMHFKLDSRYRHILLDEFQDTNPLQWLALESWFDASAQAERSPDVFMVGDPKQSIFRFRGADARLFQAARDWLVGRHAARVHAHDTSRRCAAALLDVVNAVFAAEPSYRPFARHAPHRSDVPGRVEVLPLARSTPAPVGLQSGGLRDPLREARVVEEDTRRSREAEMLVARLQAIIGSWRVVDEHDGSDRAARYADVMILVRRRTHLQIYERALRHAGIPFLTSRQGGLLDTLEAADLMALLEFLVSPFDDAKLAHALKSPLFALPDEDLFAIAQAPGVSWWERLRRLAGAGASDAVARAQELLARWLDWADRLPVHDVLDRIYFEGDIVERYRAAVPSAMRAAVGANLQAFIRRALDVDSGRYPSLPRFLAELRDMGNAPPEEAPDEGEVTDGSDAVRILTVHGAKGLEAPIVWLLDAAAPAPADRGFQALVEWLPGERAPAAFSLLTENAACSRLQRAQLEAESGYAAREALNLLYVAMTRARQALIVSGCETKGAGDSWYGRIRSAAASAAGIEAGAEEPLVHGAELAARGMAPEIGSSNLARAQHTEQTAGAQTRQLELDFDAAPHTDEYRVVPVGLRQEPVGSPGQRYGNAFHALMQHAAAGVRLDAEQWAARLGLPSAQAASLCRQAARVLADPELQRFFDARCFLRALDEWPLALAEGNLQRVDRLVEFGEEVWVLDYKTGSLETIAGTPLESDYRQQVQSYCRALSRVFPHKPVRGLLVFSDGSRLAVEAA